MHICSFFSFIFFSVSTIMQAPFPVETSNEQTCMNIERDAEIVHASKLYRTHATNLMLLLLHSLQ